MRIGLSKICFPDNDSLIFPTYGYKAVVVETESQSIYSRRMSEVLFAAALLQNGWILEQVHHLEIVTCGQNGFRVRPADSIDIEANSMWKHSQSSVSIWTGPGEPWHILDAEWFHDGVSNVVDKF